MTKITKTLLKSLSNDQSYRRGVNYYQAGDVLEVIKKGSTYEGKVAGTYQYKVRITPSSTGILDSCSCPYDWGGICKHVVAVGLTIVDGDYKVDQEHVGFKEFWEKAYLPATKTQKNIFWKDFLQSDEKLQEKFMKFVHYRPDTQEGKLKKVVQDTAYDTIITIADIADDLCETFTNFDDELIEALGNHRTYEYDSYYEEDYGASLQDAAIACIQEKLGEFKLKANYYLAEKQPANALKVVLGVYEGSYDVETPIHDEWEYVEMSLTEFIQQEWTDFGKNILLSLLANTDQQGIQDTIDLLAERIALGKDSNTAVPTYNLEQINPLFLTLTEHQPTLIYFEQALQRNHLYNFVTRPVFLRIAELQGEEQRWRTIAQEFAEDDLALTKQLLLKYEQAKEVEAYYKRAKKAFDKWSRLLDETLLEYISPDIDETFYIKVLRHFTTRTSYLLGYKRLRKFWTEEERDSYVASNKNNGAFYVKLLAVEERFEEILALAKANERSFNWRQLLIPIYNIYPDYCFNAITKKAEQRIVRERGRKYYKSIADDLKDLFKIELKGHDTKVKMFGKSLVNQYRNLPAFKDEMRKAGLFS